MKAIQGISRIYVLSPWVDEVGRRRVKRAQMGKQKGVCTVHSFSSL